MDDHKTEIAALKERLWKLREVASRVQGADALSINLREQQEILDQMKGHGYDYDLEISRPADSRT